MPSQSFQELILKRLIALLPFLLFAANLSAATSNVAFICGDDLNDWVGCMNGHPQARTSAIDSLAARGTLFTNAHCQAPICGPSRASFLLGRHPHETGLYDQPRGKAKMIDDAKAGYHPAVGFGAVNAWFTEFYAELQED